MSKRLFAAITAALMLVLGSGCCLTDLRETTESDRQEWTELLPKVESIHYDSRPEGILKHFDAQAFGFDGYAEISDEESLRRICDVVDKAVRRSSFYEYCESWGVKMEPCFSCLGAMLSFHAHGSFSKSIGMKERSLNQIATTLELSQAEYDELRDALLTGIEKAEVRVEAVREK